MAVGVSSSVAALAVAATALLVLAALRLVLAGDERLTLGGAATPLLLAGFATAYAAALATPTRTLKPPRIGTLALAVVVAAAWPVSGHALVAAILATLAVGFSVARDQRVPGGRRARGLHPTLALASTATVLSITGLAISSGHPLESAAGGGETRGAGETRGGDEARPDGDDTRGGAPRAGRPATPGGGSPAPAPREASPPRAAAPAPPGDAAADRAAAFVREYYAALDARRFDDAWATLSAAVRKRFGGFEHWRAGYGRTVSSRPQAIAVETLASDGVVVRHTLLARDRGCGTTKRYRMTWTLTPAKAKDSWTVTRLEGRPLGTPRCG